MNKQLLYQDKKIHYRVIGNGQPVFLLHGFGEDGEIFNLQVAHLKRKFQLIVPDLPGSGQSKMISDMSIEGMAKVINEIIKKEKIETCPVIGHSMGGYITLALVENYRKHISAFGLFHSSAYADSEEKIAGRKKAIDFIKQNGAYEFLKTAIPNLFADESKEKLKTTIQELIEQGQNFSTQSLVSYYEAMIQRPDRTEILKKATIPVLFIMGKHDNAVPVKDMLEQSHLPKKSYIHMLQQSGHMGMLEETNKCNQMLEQFLLEI